MMNKEQLAFYEDKSVPGGMKELPKPILRIVNHIDNFSVLSHKT
jgi:hypothetical protein